jgi:hypothetical protein
MLSCVTFRSDEENEESFKKVLKSTKKQAKESYAKPSISSLVGESKRIKERQQRLTAEDLKNMPSEVSSKFPVPRMKVAIPVQKKKVFSFSSCLSSHFLGWR